MHMRGVAFGVRSVTPLAKSTFSFYQGMLIAGVPPQRSFLR
jgi:hypothetical protein